MKDLLPNIEVYRIAPDASDESVAANTSDSDNEPTVCHELNTGEEPNFSLGKPNTPVEVIPTREPVRVILVGSGIGTNLVIGVLHTLGFAEPRAWSKPQIDPASGKPMRILTKWVRH
ncbi:MAG: hypothetical protein AAGE59_15550 [Cyanobacteria bacterium P01_F01_bin.86]